MAADAAPDWRRTYTIALAAVIVGALCYMLADWRGWPRAVYDPYLDRWSMKSGATPKIGINFYGGMLWGALGAAIGATLGAVAHRWLDRPAARTLLAAWAFTAFALAGAYYWWNLWPL